MRYGCRSGPCGPNEVSASEPLMLRLGSSLEFCLMKRLEEGAAKQELWQKAAMRVYA